MAKVCILGGGIIGLALAAELRLQGAEVIVLDRGCRPAAWAAAGMLAPQAEGLGGPLVRLGLYSRALWPDWAARLEALSGRSAGYWASGILLPARARDLAAMCLRSAGGEWLDRDAVEARVPGIGTDVLAGLWFARDACANSRETLAALREACRRLGVDLRDGIAVHGPADDGLRRVATSAGPVEAELFVLAQGSWSGEWLDLPVRPLKGQMLALQARQTALATVLYGEGIYLVPRRDGRIVVGATEEWVGFAPGTTDEATGALLASACELLPELSHCPVIERWWGFRPATPDGGPILGRGPWPHLYLATGHHRNGVLLAPATARLLARQILTGEADALLEPFGAERFAPARR
jgi:glycine oxidase ThiO